ncbi:hypothetical protein Elgi_47350 [Paenibacillus elgii]|nr:hypothetical protein Elgi_47350 [Paenibacillus elgii]
MHIKQQPVALRRSFDQSRPQERRFPQIKRPDKAGHCRFSLRFSAYPDALQRKIRRLRNALNRLAVRIQLERGAQRGMTTEQPAKRRFKPRRIQLALHPQFTRHVVAGRRSFQLA